MLGIIQGLASVLSVDAGSIKVRLTLQATAVVISYSISVPTTLFASLELKLESTTVVQLQTAITVGLRATLMLIQVPTITVVVLPVPKEVKVITRIVFLSVTNAVLLEANSRAQVSIINGLAEVLGVRADFISMRPLVVGVQLKVEIHQRGHRPLHRAADEALRLHRGAARHHHPGVAAANPAARAHNHACPRDDHTAA